MHIYIQDDIYLDFVKSIILNVANKSARPYSVVFLLSVFCKENICSLESSFVLVYFCFCFVCINNTRIEFCSNPVFSIHYHSLFKVSFLFAFINSFYFPFRDILSFHFSSFLYTLTLFLYLDYQQFFLLFSSLFLSLIFIPSFLHSFIFHSYFHIVY